MSVVSKRRGGGAPAGTQQHGRLLRAPATPEETRIRRLLAHLLALGALRAVRESIDANTNEEEDHGRP